MPRALIKHLSVMHADGWRRVSTDGAQTAANTAAIVYLRCASIVQGLDRMRRCQAPTLLQAMRHLHTCRCWCLCRRLEEEEDSLSRMEFRLPPDALVPLPSGDRPSQQHTTRSRAPSFGGDPFAEVFGAPAQQPPARSAAGKMVAPPSCM